MLEELERRERERQEGNGWPKVIVGKSLRDATSRGPRAGTGGRERPGGGGKKVCGEMPAGERGGGTGGGGGKGGGQGEGGVGAGGGEGSRRGKRNYYYGKWLEKP